MVGYSHRFYSFIIIFCTLVLLAACGREEKQVGDESIRIYLFKSGNPALEGRTFETINGDEWKSLLTVDLGQSDFVINEDDLESYDWSQQHLTLTSNFREEYERQDYEYIVDYFVFVLGETPVVGGVVLHPFSAVFSRIPTLENYHVVMDSEDTTMELTLRMGNVPSTVPLFPGEDETLTERVRQRLLAVGKLVETVEPEAGSTTSAELVIVSRLVQIENTPHCGIFHFGAIAEYTDLTVTNGTYPYETIFVIHGCPELKRSEYAQGSGDLEAFAAGDYHELHLTQQNVYDVTTYPTDLKDLSGSLYFSRVVNLYSD